MVVVLVVLLRVLIFFLFLFLFFWKNMLEIWSIRVYYFIILVLECVRGMCGLGLGLECKYRLECKMEKPGTTKSTFDPKNIREFSWIYQRVQLNLVFQSFHFSCFVASKMYSSWVSKIILFVGFSFKEPVELELRDELELSRLRGRRDSSVLFSSLKRGRIISHWFVSWNWCF